MFDHNEVLSVLQTNYYRTIGAIIFFIIFSMYRPIPLVKPFLKLPKIEKKGVVFGAFIGTFVSLTLYLGALQYAHLASFAGIAITSAIFSSLIECLWSKKWPSIYLIAAFVSFMFGMRILVF